MHDRLAPGELFRADLFLSDFLTQMTVSGFPQYPEPKFFLALRIATENDERRWQIARNRELDAAELVRARHEVVLAWSEGGTTKTRPEAIQLESAFWDSRQARPDLHEKSVQRHRREALAQKRAAAAGAPVAVATKRL